MNEIQSKRMSIHNCDRVMNEDQETTYKAMSRECFLYRKTVQMAIGS